MYYLCLAGTGVINSNMEITHKEKRFYSSAKSVVIELCLERKHRKTVNSRRCDYVKDNNCG